MSITKDMLLKDIPDSLKTPLLEEFNKVVRNFRERRWEPAELNGGKLCEIIYSILKGYIDGQYPVAPYKPANIVDDCRAFEKIDKKFPRSIRIQIPRIIISLYEIRNNRGVGHVGGEVNPNEMDASAVLSLCKWLLAELIRLFHNLSTDEATEAVSLITERTTPVIWEVDGKKRVLTTGLTQKNKTLLLLYSCSNGATEGDLIKWTEHSNPSIYRRDILVKLHKEKLIEYDKEDRSAKISPTGITLVEERFTLNF